MAGQYPGFNNPNHQGTFPNQMRQMGGMMNMQGMQGQMGMMGQQSMQFSQGGMQGTGMHTISNSSQAKYLRMCTKCVYLKSRNGRPCEYAKSVASPWESSNAHTAASKCTATTKSIRESRKFFIKYPFPESHSN